MVVVCIALVLASSNTIKRTPYSRTFILGIGIKYLEKFISNYNLYAESLFKSKIWSQKDSKKFKKI